MAKNRLEEACDNYDPDKDYNGKIGMTLAELKLKRKGYPSVLPIKKNIKEIITLSPKDIRAAPDVNSRVKEYLADLKNTGYTVNNDYRKMNPTDLWNYFLKVLGENDYFKRD